MNRLVKALCLGLCLLNTFALPAVSQNGSDYLCEEHRSLNSLLDQRWLPEEFPLKVYIPPIPYNMPNRGQYVRWVQASFAAWGSYLPALRFKFVDNPNAASIKIIWHEHFKPTDPAWGKANLPLRKIDPVTRKMTHFSNIYLALKAQPGSGFSVHEAIPFSQREFMAITTHEVGHALGLHHSNHQGDLMSRSVFRLMPNAQFVITQRDLNTLVRLYRLPRKTQQHPCR